MAGRRLSSTGPSWETLPPGPSSADGSDVDEIAQDLMGGITPKKRKMPAKDASVSEPLLKRSKSDNLPQGAGPSSRRDSGPPSSINIRHLNADQSTSNASSSQRSISSPSRVSLPTRPPTTIRDGPTPISQPIHSSQYKGRLKQVARKSTGTRSVSSTNGKGKEKAVDISDSESSAANDRPSASVSARPRVMETARKSTGGLRPRLSGVGKQKEAQRVPSDSSSSSARPSLPAKSKLSTGATSKPSQTTSTIGKGKGKETSEVLSNKSQGSRKTSSSSDILEILSSGEERRRARQANKPLHTARARASLSQKAKAPNKNQAPNKSPEVFVISSDDEVTPAKLPRPHPIKSQSTGDRKPKPRIPLKPRPPRSSSDEVIVIDSDEEMPPPVRPRPSLTTQTSQSKIKEPAYAAPPAPTVPELKVPTPTSMDVEEPPPENDFDVHMDVNDDVPMRDRTPTPQSAPTIPRKSAGVASGPTVSRSLDTASSTSRTDGAAPANPSTSASAAPVARKSNSNEAQQPKLPLTAPVMSASAPLLKSVSKSKSPTTDPASLSSADNKSTSNAPSAKPVQRVALPGKRTAILEPRPPNRKAPPVPPVSSKPPLKRPTPPDIVSSLVPKNKTDAAPPVPPASTRPPHDSSARPASASSSAAPISSQKPPIPKRRPLPIPRPPQSWSHTGPAQEKDKEPEKSTPALPRKPQSKSAVQTTLDRHVDFRAVNESSNGTKTQPKERDTPTPSSAKPQVKSSPRTPRLPNRPAKSNRGAQSPQGQASTTRPTIAAMLTDAGKRNTTTASKPKSPAYIDLSRSDDDTGNSSDEVGMAEALASSSVLANLMSASRVASSTPTPVLQSSPSPAVTDELNLSPPKEVAATNDSTKSWPPLPKKFDISQPTGVPLIIPRVSADEFEAMRRRPALKSALLDAATSSGSLGLTPSPPHSLPLLSRSEASATPVTEAFVSATSTLSITQSTVPSPPPTPPPPGQADFGEAPGGSAHPAAPPSINMEDEEEEEELAVPTSSTSLFGTSPPPELGGSAPEGAEHEQEESDDSGLEYIEFPQDRGTLSAPNSPASNEEMAVDEGALPELQTTSVSAVVPTSTSGLAAMDIDQETSVSAPTNEPEPAVEHGDGDDAPLATKSNTVSTDPEEVEQIANDLLPMRSVSPASSGMYIRRSTRASRRSSGASSSDDSVKVPLDNEYDDTPADSPLRSPTPDNVVSSSGSTLGGLPVLTWRDFSQDHRNFTPRTYYARDLDRSLQDYLNSYSRFTIDLPKMRHVWESAARENTADDEPDAPPIILENEVDQQPAPPWEFHYSNQMWLGEGVPEPKIEGLTSCGCIGKCDPKSKTCACVKRQEKWTKQWGVDDFMFDKMGRLKIPDMQLPIFECNDQCRCDDECRNRIVQNGRKIAVKVAKTAKKGWGVFATDKKIHKGTFVGIYAGELLLENEADERGLTYNKFGRTYLFTLDFFHMKSGDNDNDWVNEYVVDAYHAGNFTRFLNHSCDPNCHLLACYINEADIGKPLLAFFAKKDIRPGEELTFSYNGNTGDDTDSVISTSPQSSPAKAAVKDDAIYSKCECGAYNCTGKLFV